MSKCAAESCSGWWFCGSGADRFLDFYRAALRAWMGAAKEPLRRCGAVAQMGERCNRTAEVRGSIPLSSTSQAENLFIFRRWSETRRRPYHVSVPQADAL